MARSTVQLFAVLGLLPAVISYTVIILSLASSVYDIDPFYAFTGPDRPLFLLASGVERADLPYVGPEWRDHDGEFFGAVGGPAFFGTLTLSTIFLGVLPVASLWVRLVGPMSAILMMLISTVTVIATYALIYQLGGIKIDGCLNPDPDFTEALYLSMTMMSSLGFGDMIGAPPVRLYVATQAFFGFFMLGWVLGLSITAFNRLPRPHKSLMSAGFGLTSSKIS